MGQFVVGQVVVCRFPFFDLKTTTCRPALVVATADFDDVILCQITSKTYSSSYPVQLTPADFSHGDLPVVSYVRPDKLFTTDTSVIEKVHGMLTLKKLDEVLAAIRAQF